MVCHNCQLKAKRFGKDRKGTQRYRCNGCRKTFSELHDRPLGTMRLPIDRAIQVLKLLVEGVSVRSAERITGVEKKTILSLLERVGERCEMLLENLIRDVVVKDVQCDELWGYVQMKEKTKTKKALASEKLGDAYCFVAIERDSKLILSWHLGRRSASDTNLFIDKLDKATQGKFQITTDVLLFFVAWIIISTILDGSRRRKETILQEMKDSYSKREALDLMYGMKRQAMVLYLAYGLVLGVFVASIIMGP